MGSKKNGTNATGLRRIAIACQGGGIHGAFTSGVMDAILRHQEKGRKNSNADGVRFAICGLSGTSAGALNAFLVWYAMMLHYDQPCRYREARKALNRLWDAFSADRLGEQICNHLWQNLFELGRFGLTVKHPLPPFLHYGMTSLFSVWSMFERALSINPLLMDVDMGQVRETFYDFQSLLKTCAPHFDEVQAQAALIAKDRRDPRLLLGAVDVINGRFQAFDSYAKNGLGGRISFDAVEASGTLPEIHRAHPVDDQPGGGNGNSLYWDGLFSQNPPIREFLAGKKVPAEDKPDEIWVIRINPQKMTGEPVFLSTIEDRRNELAGNLSLNQELYFIDQVNDWLDETVFSSKQKERFKPIRVYVITMFEETSSKLRVNSKFDRDPSFIRELREEGKVRGKRFLKLWKPPPENDHTETNDCELRPWRSESSLDAIPHCYDDRDREILAKRLAGKRSRVASTCVRR